MPTVLPHSCEVCQQIVIKLQDDWGDINIDKLLEQLDGDQSNCALAETFITHRPTSWRLWPADLKGKRELWIGDERYRVYASEDNSAARFIVSRPPDHDVHSSKSIQLARQWLQSCNVTHILCPGPRAPRLPTRVLDVGVTPYRLHTPRPGTRAYYAALSYCWGGPQPVVTTKASSTDFSVALPVHQLPQTIKDAISVTQDLGLRYLWVDALCIVQDDEPDRSRELGKMGLIYSNAHVTVSAATAKSCYDGFLQVRESNGIRLRAICPNGTPGSIILYKMSGDTQIDLAENEPIYTRAWTLQESLLSPRLLIYGSHHVEWRCAERNVCGTGQTKELFWDERNLGRGHALLVAKYGRDKAPDSLLRKVLWRTGLGTRVSDFLDSLELPEYKLRFNLQSWTSLVKAYTSRSMSMTSDRLVAIGGVAETLHRKELGQYLAGLWTFGLARQMLWYRTKDQEALPRPSAYRAPSWSWACIDGAVEILNASWIGLDDMRDLAEILDAEVQPATSLTQYTAFKSGRVRIRGRLVTARLDVSNSRLLAFRFPPADIILDASDAWTEPQAQIWCLEIMPQVKGDYLDSNAHFAAGLVLLSCTSPKTYRRAGFFKVAGSFLSWFPDAKVEEICIV